MQFLAILHQRLLGTTHYSSSRPLLPELLLYPLCFADWQRTKLVTFFRMRIVSVFLGGIFVDFDRLFLPFPVVILRRGVWI